MRVVGLVAFALLAAPACNRPAGDEGAALDSAALLARLPPADRPTLDRERASRFAGLALACVHRAFPNKPSHVYDSEADLVPPTLATPAFYGCFDWHSAVHGHWALVRLLTLFPELPEAAAIRAALDEDLTPTRLAGELAFFGAPRNRTFERPYGWGWLLRLATELGAAPGPDAARWNASLAPLSHHLAGLFGDYLERLSLPVRSGQHQNTAFALVHLLDFARATGDAALLAAASNRAKSFYAADRDCPTEYEPSGEDFLSPCLAEADVMRRVLPPAELAVWLDRFLPAPASPAFAPLRSPPPIGDLTDPKLVHLVGLSFHRAACLEGLARDLPPGDGRAPVFARIAALHADTALRQMQSSDYGGEHWLASFAIAALAPAVEPGRRRSP
jgi:hypothetical protein